MSKEKKMAIAALCGLIVVIIAIILLIPSCDASSSTTASKTGSISSMENAVVKNEDVTAKSTLDSDTAKDSSGKESGETAKSNATRPSSVPQSSSGSSSSGSKSDPAPPKKWIPDYKKVWVEDSATWDEQVPIYDDVEVSICNVCGADITGNEVAHAKQHALAGEGGGHHNDYRSILVGYETVHHEAVGHWETVENGGHWE